MKNHQSIVIILSSVLVLAATVSCVVFFNRGSELKPASPVQVSPETNSDVGAQNVVPAPVEKSAINAQSLLRAKIAVGEKFKVKEGQIRNSDLTFNEQEEIEITITSVKRVYMQDSGNGHTLFQGCFLVQGGYSCNLFVLNNTDTLVQLTQSIQLDMRDGKNYDYEVKQKTKEDILNGTSKEFFVRVDEAPYIYQTIVCGDGTTSSSCRVIGMDPDNINGKTGMATKEIASYMTRSTFGLDSYPAIAEKRISRTIFATTTALTVQEDEQEDRKTKRVSVSLEKNKGGAIQQFESNEDINALVKVDYDYVNLADVATVTIGTKKFTYTFSTGVFMKVTQ